MNRVLFYLLSCIFVFHFSLVCLPGQDIRKKSPIIQPYPYVSSGKFTGPAIPESSDPLVNYQWPNPIASNGLEIYLLKPESIDTDQPTSFRNLQSLAGNSPDVLVQGTGSIRLDFGLESGAWVEFDSPDCPGGVEMSISEYNEPGVEKTADPVKYGNTYRLELNKELYEGVRFAWIHIKTFDYQWHITGIRAVCQVKPTNYKGSFSCNDPMLTKIWYMSAYSVKASLCKDYFGAILMDRGDRMSWTGDAHTSQAAALVAFGNFDFIRKNIDNTSEQSNGIRSYSLYWVLSLIDYYNYTGDTATLNRYIYNACKKLDQAYTVFGTNPGLRFYGWDERLCAGFEIWFKESQEAQNAYKMLSIRAWQDFATAMGKYGRTDLKGKYEKYAAEKLSDLRRNEFWYSGFGLHAAADAVNTGLLNNSEQKSLFEKLFLDRVNRVSLSPFNQYFIIQAMARLQKYDDALSTVRDLWGGMINYGGTTTFEVFRPSWNQVISPNDAVPNTQSGITSLCHPWGAGPVKWLNEEVLGIVPTFPGFKTWDVVPHPGRTLTRVSGKTPTPYGPISASFDFSSGLCKVTSPKETIGRIGIPKVEKTIKQISINGKLAWDGTYHSVSGITGANEEQEFVYFTDVKPGTYDISISYMGTTPAYNEPPEQYDAQFIKHDTTTSGNWGGIYGKDGYILCNYKGEGLDKQTLPLYVTSVDYFRAFPKNGLPDPTLWASGVLDNRALAGDPGNPFPRNATSYSNTDQTMSVTINIDGTKGYQIALYFVDWEKRGSRQVVEMFDAATLNLIAPVQIVNNYSSGRYLVYAYNKSVKFRIDKVRGEIVSLSGIFFDPKMIP
ncbi:MAG: alpha-L-rhamnosidase C-terminal domain-containing protein [Bacteroidales bacterium]